MLKNLSKTKEIEQNILKHISMNQLQPNDAILPENSMTVMYDVSRVTVRKAIANLVARGILRKEKGRGTFVNQLPLNQPQSTVLHKQVAFTCFGGIDSPYIGAMARGVESAATKDGFVLLIGSVLGGADVETEVLRSLIDRNVDGLIVVPSESNPPNEFLISLITAGANIVIADENINGLSAPAVLCDDVEGGFMATEALIKAGHKRIAHIGGPSLKNNALERFHGYSKALERYNIKYDSELVPPFEAKSGGHVFARRAMQNLLTLPAKKRPTAIFTANDSMAEGAWEIIEKNGYAVPTDFSLIGYGNTPNNCGYSLSSIGQSPRAIGENAWQILKGILDKQPNIRDKKVLLRPELILRQSIRML